MKLFMSKKEKEKLERKKKRAAFRDADRVVDNVKDKIRELKVDRDKQWEAARKYLKEGKKTAARRAVQAVRARELLMDQLDKKRLICEDRIIKLDMANMDNSFIESLNTITNLVNIDPDELVETMDSVQDKLEEVEENDKIWNKFYEKDMLNAEYTDSEIVDSVDNLLSQLESEVAVEVRGSELEDGETENSIMAEISEGRNRLNKLLEEDK